MRKLQDVLDDIPFENLPPAWTTFDLAAFSRSKQLRDYQHKEKIVDFRKYDDNGHTNTCT